MTRNWEIKKKQKKTGFFLTSTQRANRALKRIWMSDCLVLESYRNGQTQMHYNCVCHSLTPFPFVVVTLKSRCDKCMTPTWIMDDPTGQALGPKAVRGYGPLCVTALTPYKFTSSQNWHSVVLSNPQLTLKSSWYVTAWMCATLRVLIFSFNDMHVHYKGTTTSTCCSILEAGKLLF